MAEEKLVSRLLLRRISDCMDRNACQWLLEEMAGRDLRAAEVTSAIQKVAELDGRKLGKYQIDDILTKIEEGMDADGIVEFYQNAVARIVKETDTFIDYLNYAKQTIRISKQSEKTIDAMIASKTNSTEIGDRVEAKVADYIKHEMGVDLTDFANKIK